MFIMPAFPASLWDVWIVVDFCIAWKVLCLAADQCGGVACLACRLAALEKAEAEKVQVVKAAEADAEAKYLQGQGIARQRQAIVNGLRESVLNFERDVSDISSRDVIEVCTAALACLALQSGIVVVCGCCLPCSLWHYLNDHSCTSDCCKPVASCWVVLRNIVADIRWYHCCVA